MRSQSQEQGKWDRNRLQHHLWGGIRRPVTRDTNVGLKGQYPGVAQGQQSWVWGRRMGTSRPGWNSWEVGVRSALRKSCFPCCGQTSQWDYEESDTSLLLDFRRKPKVLQSPTLQHLTLRSFTPWLRQESVSHLQPREMLVFLHKTNKSSRLFPVLQEWGVLSLWNCPE